MKTITSVTLFILLSGCHFHTISPTEMTHTAMTETFVRVQMYAKEHSKIPYSFDVLPIRNGYINKTTDGWGRVFILEIKDDKIMTITSYGKDGKPGGHEENSDISRSHWLRNPDGSLWVGKELWGVRSEII